MQTPRWFYVVLAGCATILTLTSSYVLISRRDVGRWMPVGNITDQDIRAMDTATGTICLMSISSGKIGDACIEMQRGLIRRWTPKSIDEP